MNDALQRKGSQRPDGDDLFSLDQNSDAAPMPISGPIRRTTHLIEPETIRKRRQGTGPVLLDEIRLQRALKSKAERRQAAENSADRRRQARNSMDRLIDSTSDTVRKEKYPKAFTQLHLDNQVTAASNASTEIRPDSETGSTSLQRETVAAKKPISDLYPTQPVSPRRQKKTVISKPPLASVSVGSAPTKIKVETSARKIKPKTKASAPTNPSEPESVASNVPQEASYRSASGRKIVKKKKIIRRVKKKGIEGSTTTDDNDPTSAIPVMGVNSTTGSSRSPKKVKKKIVPVIKPKSATTSEDSQNSTSSATPAKVIQVTRENSAPQDGAAAVRNKKKKRLSSQRSIFTTSTAKRSSDNVSTSEDPSVVSNLSARIASMEPASSHSHLQGDSKHSQKSSSQKFQPFSWSIRNEAHTGFAPNDYVTKETMTEFTENLGGVETVATTTKIFFDRAKHDPELKAYFRSTKWEHVRNEFIILANLQVPTSFDENIKGVLEHHCKILENGANIERLIAIWESAIESSWLDHHMDDARKLIVGPSRVIFNLKALERHYAMHQKALRAAARASGAKEKEVSSSQRSGGILERLWRGQ